MTALNATAGASTTDAPNNVRSVVLRRYEQLQRHHNGLKQKRFGFLLRPFILIAGWLVVVAGIIAIPFPGPGWATVFVGVGILSLELAIFQRLLFWGLGAYEKFWGWYSTKPKLWRISFWAFFLTLGGVITLGVLYGLWSLGLANYMGFIFA